VLDWMVVLDRAMVLGWTVLPDSKVVLAFFAALVFEVDLELQVDLEGDVASELLLELGGVAAANPSRTKSERSTQSVSKLYQPIVVDILTLCLHVEEKSG